MWLELQIINSQLKGNERKKQNKIKIRNKPKQEQRTMRTHRKPIYLVSFYTEHKHTDTSLCRRIVWQQSEMQEKKSEHKKEKQNQKGNVTKPQSK